MYMRLWLAAFILILAVSCRPTDPDELGSFTVEVQVYHHATSVANIDVYLMEYAEEFPGDNLSDYHFKATSDSIGKAYFSGILPGEHWIAGYGFDGVDTVKGNTAIYLDPQDSDQHAKAILYVTEKH